jgi:hypothetical protein
MGRKRDPKYDDAYELYVNGLSLDQVAKSMTVTRQCVFKAFKNRGFELRDKTNITPTGYEALVKNGKRISASTERKFRKYQIYDDKKFTLRNHGYYALTTGNRTLMHRYVWEIERDTIQNGWDIHHLNENKEDNRIANLECLPKSEHTRLYSPHNNQYTKGRKRDTHRTI